MHDLLPLIAQHGLAFVFANVLLEKVGAPIPAMPMLIVAGALVADGRLALAPLLWLTLLACIAGDAIWYAAGRRYGGRVMRLLCRISMSPDSCVRQTESYFERWGKWSLVLGKFIPGLSTIGPPLAGATGVGWVSFLALNTLGSLLWLAPTIAFGMLFHAQIDAILVGIENLGVATLWLAAALLALYVTLKGWQRWRFIRALRLARISVAELKRLMTASPQEIVVVDVRTALSRRSDPRAIPGALAVEVSDLARLGDLPADRELVFYCNCPNDASAALVAKRLIDRGYTRVRPLAGGLDAWAAAGYDLNEA